jgi:serine/threonine protein kinase
MSRLEKLDNYKVLKTLGKGAFGTTYLAESDGIRYVLKHIDLKVSTLADVSNEVEALKKITKYNKCDESGVNSSSMCLIADFIDYSSNKYVIVTNYLVDAIPLRSLMEEKKKKGEFFDFDVIIFMMSRLISQLYQLHKHGIVHSDIKPENIIVQYTDNQIKNVLFIDFGVSCLKNCVPRGTLLYMAPEILRVIGYDSQEKVLKLKEKLIGEGKELEGKFLPIYKSDYKKVDVFSLGIVFFELLNNKYPYPYESDYIREKEREMRYNLNEIGQSEEEELNSLKKYKSEGDILSNDSYDNDSYNTDSYDSDSDLDKNIEILKRNLPVDIIPSGNALLQNYKLVMFYKSGSVRKSDYKGSSSEILNNLVDSMLQIDSRKRPSIHKVKQLFGKLTLSLLVNGHFPMGSRGIMSPGNVLTIDD